MASLKIASLNTGGLKRFSDSKIVKSLLNVDVILYLQETSNLGSPKLNFLGFSGITFKPAIRDGPGRQRSGFACLAKDGKNLEFSKVALLEHYYWQCVRTAELLIFNIYLRQRTRRAMTFFFRSLGTDILTAIGNCCQDGDYRRAAALFPSIFLKVEANIQVTPRSVSNLLF